MWLPKCCSYNNYDDKFRHTVKIYYKSLNTRTENNTQKNSYSRTQILSKRCYIKERSVIAQDTAINNGIRNLENTKELIFKYFDITNYTFNEIDINGSRYQVIGSSYLYSITLDSKKYQTTNQRPFVSILVGLKKL